MDNSLQRRLPQELELSVYEVARKEIVLKQDTYCNHLYVLLKGELEVNIVDVAGNLVKVEDIRAPRAFATPHLFGDKNLLWSIRFLRIQPCWSTIRFNWQNIWE